MRKIIIALSSFVIIAGMGAFAWQTCAAEEPLAQAEEGGEAAAGGDCCKADDETPPLDLIKATPKGGLHNPYNDKIAETTHQHLPDDRTVGRGSPARGSAHGQVGPPPGSRP